jgi:hypothetical protein
LVTQQKRRIFGGKAVFPLNFDPQVTGTFRYTAQIWNHSLTTTVVLMTAHVFVPAHAMVLMTMLMTVFMTALMDCVAMLMTVLMTVIVVAR